MSVDPDQIKFLITDSSNLNQADKVQGLTLTQTSAYFQGAQGATGLEGEVGADGGTGAAGPAGPAGPPGSSGSSGGVQTGTSSIPTFASSGTQPVFSVGGASRLNYVNVGGSSDKLIHLSGVIDVSAVTTAGTGHYRITLPNAFTYKSTYYGTGPHILGTADINGTMGYIGISPDDVATTHLSLFTTPTGTTALTCGVTDGLAPVAVNNYYSFSAVFVID